jgi:MFS family permease
MTRGGRGFGLLFQALVAATFLGFLGMGTVLPELAPHVRHDLGGSDRTVGYVIGIFSIMALVSRFVSGPLADGRGRKLAFIAGLMSCAMAGVAYLLPIGIAGAYIGRLLQGFGEACLYTGAAAWAVELAGVHRSSQALGYISSGIWGGISAGPVVGQWLGSFQRAAIVQTVLALAACALLLFVPEHYKPSSEPRTGPWIPRSVWAPGFAVGFFNVSLPVVTGFLVLHLAGHGNSGPAAFTAWACLILASRFFLGGIPDRTHPRIAYYAGLAMMCAALLVLATGPRPAIAIGSAALLGFGFSFPWTAVVSSVIKRTPAHEHGTIVGVLSAFYDVFVGISSFAAGEVASRFGYPATFVMGAVAAVFAAALGLLVFPHGEDAAPPLGDDEAYLEPIEL